MKKYVSFILFILLLFCFSVSVFAITPYSNVTEDTQQIKILYNAMINDPAYIYFFPQWFAYRHDEYDYRLYFVTDLHDFSNGCYYRYYATQNGYNYIWHLERVVNITIPDVDFTTYTCVGNYPFTLHSDIVDKYNIRHILFPFLIFIGFVIPFSVFRVRKGRYL